MKRGGAPGRPLSILSFHLSYLVRCVAGARRAASRSSLLPAVVSSWVVASLEV